MKEDDRGTGHIPLLAYYGGHEIGLFLGYPSKDVAAFMENSSAGVKYLGMWKVYSDVETAKIKFARYRECTRAYCEAFRRGHTFDRLMGGCS